MRDYELRQSVFLQRLAAILLLCLGAVSHSPAAVTNLRVKGATSTKIIISFYADVPTNCTIEVSQSATFTPLAPDVDTAQYGAAANDCNRAGNVVNGKYVEAVIGKRGGEAIEKALDQYTKSRALYAYTNYFIRVTSGDSATITAMTANIPVGDTRGDSLPVLEPFKYKTVTPNSAVLPEFAEPFTGVRIVRPAHILAFGYGGSSATFPEGGPPAACGKTLTGVIIGACLFEDATGTNWAATTGTLTDAIIADDANYAEYAGTTQDPLYLRLGTGKYPFSSTPLHTGSLASQNVAIKIKTNDAIGEGGIFDICLTLNATECHSPRHQYTLSDTDELGILICKDIPCSTPDEPGDVMVDNSLMQYNLVKGVKGYNTSGDLTTINLVGTNATSFCNSIYTGELITLADQVPSERSITVTSKDCGASPPNVVSSTNPYNFHYNGTSGTGISLPGATNTNPRVGLLIRKVSTTSSSTISVGYALHRWTVSTPISLALGSGGFGKRVSLKQKSDGKYIAQFNQQLVGIEYDATGKLSFTNYGYAYTRGDFVASGLLAEGVYGCMGGASTNDSTWSDELENVFFCQFRSTYANPWTGGGVDNRNVFAKVTLDTSTPKANGNPNASGLPGLSDKAQRMTFTAGEVLTPCTAPCDTTALDFTPYGQKRRFTSDKWTTTFSSCSIQTVTGKYIVEQCLNGSQDSLGWVFVYDTSIAAGNDQIIAALEVANCPNTRWCGIHTFQGPLSVPVSEYVTLEGSNKPNATVTVNTALSSCSTSGAGTCSPCPTGEDGIMDGFDYSEKNWCATIDIDSQWDAGWTPSTPPAGFEVGDPLYRNGVEGNANFRTWGGKLIKGDLIQQGTEIMRVIKDNSNIQKIVVRGWGSACTTCSSSSIYNPIAHNSGLSYKIYCGALPKSPLSVDPERIAGISWFFKLTPDGSDPAYAFRDIYQNHGGHGGSSLIGGFAYSPEFNIKLHTLNDPASLLSGANSIASLPIFFAGLSNHSLGGVPGNNCAGNACEKHPTWGHPFADLNTQLTFFDVHPRLMHGQSPNTGYQNVAGTTNIRRWAGSHPLYPKLYDLESYSGPWPFMRVDSLTDDLADSGKDCYSYIADACFAGSLAGVNYDVFEEADIRYINASTAACREAEFGTVQPDRCLGNTAGINASVAQWRIPTGGKLYPNGTAQRVISKYGRIYRDVATANAKTDPLGKSVLERGLFYLIPPPMPPITTAPATFRSIPINVSHVPSGTSTIIAEFGYDTNYRCSSVRGEKCISESSTLVSGANPYLWDGETVTGLSCTSPTSSSPCRLIIPARINHALYYTVVYRDMAGTEIRRDPTSIIAVD